MTSIRLAAAGPPLARNKGWRHLGPGAASRNDERVPTHGVVPAGSAGTQEPQKVANFS